MYPLESQDDLAMRLNGCACMYKGLAYVIRTSLRNDPNVVGIYPMRSPSTEVTLIKTDDPDFFVTDYKLGYINFISFKKADQGSVPHAAYVTRYPNRQQRQGLATGLLSYSTVCNKNPYNYHNLRDWSSQHADMLEDIYPTFQHALRLVIQHRGESPSVAFHSDWCIMAPDAYTVQLAHRDTVVGVYSPKKSLFQINTDIPGTSYLMKELEALGIGVEAYAGGTFT